jgi:hypothetical protein
MYLLSLLSEPDTRQAWSLLGKQSDNLLQSDSVLQH